MNEIEERETSVRVLLGDGDHQAEVGFDHLGLGLQCLPLEVLQLTEGGRVFVQRHADELLQRFNFPLLGMDNSLGLGGTLLGLELLDGTDGRLELLVNVLRHQRHFLDDLLLVVELRERFLELVVELLELGDDFLPLYLGLQILQFTPVLVDLLVDATDVFGKLAERL